MTMDISGQTFDPRDNHSDLLIAQGKLTLDSEQNAAADARDRRWRVETMDLVGRAGYPAGLPDSFRITLGSGGLEIGVGRMYVDGLLAENHGPTATEGGTVKFDAAHAELRSSTPVAFDRQPYLPGAVQPDAVDGDVMVYLDVWRREVNHLKDPTLVEPAVGVDTAGRSQTVWQVRALAVDDGVTCATPDDSIEDWAAVIAPSTVRLTTLLVPVADPDNPCEIPPGQQLRTTENRTYRVETHGLGGDGRVLLKWSRTNASVATRVRSLDSATQITVAEVARDDVHRFVPGDWIELVDDRLEFAGEPGLMRMVATADPATNVLTFTGPIATGTFPTDADGVPDPDLNLRIVRWDQRGVVRASGGAVLADLTDTTGPGVFPAPPPGEFVELEAGIAVSVSFAQGPAKVRVGDHWIFRARAVTGTIDLLEQAPPAGVHHHYTRLAVIEAGVQAFEEPIEDCRDPIDPDEVCCCTAVVLPGESIQQAIDQLPPAGGCVCLKPGEHVLPQTLLLTRGNITLHGEAKGVTLRAPAGAPALRLSGTAARPVARTRIHTFAFAADVEGGTGTNLVDMEGAEDIVLSDCDLLGGRAGIGTGVRLAAATDISILNCRIERTLVGVLAETRCAGIAVRDCRMALGTARENAGLVGVVMINGIGPIEVSSSTIAGALAGVIVNDDIGGTPASLATRSSVIDCTIDCAAREGEALPGLSFGIDMAADQSRASGNQVTSPSPGQVGIRIAGTHSSVTANHCRYLGDTPSAATIGIVVGSIDETGETAAQADGMTVSGNTIEGPQTGIAALDAVDCRISGNRVIAGGRGQAVFGIVAIGCTALDIADNSVADALAAIHTGGGRRSRVEGNRVEGGGFGITVFDQEGPTIVGNRLRDTTQAGIRAMRCTERVRIAGNRTIRCGSGAGIGLGIATFLVLGEVDVTDNEVMDTGESTTDASAVTAIGIFGDLVLEALIQSNLVTYSANAIRDVANEDRALRFRGLLETSVVLGDSRLTFGFPIRILGNSFVGTGQTALVELLEQRVTDTAILRFERVTFNDNYCMHTAPAPNDSRATVSLRGHRGVIVGNQVKSTTGAYFPFDLHGMSATYVGNVAESVPLQGATIPVPVGNFNLDS